MRVPRQLRQLFTYVPSGYFVAAALGLSAGLARAQDFIGPPRESPQGPPRALRQELPETYPLENREKRPPPSADSAALAGAAILKAIIADQPEDAGDWFFPAAPFEVLKDIPRPNEYYAQLVNWYFSDMRRIRARFKSTDEVAFDGFKLGFCVWKDAGSEYNRIPYWSCYHSQLYFKVKNASDESRQALEIRTMINWGRVWYVTHLGHLPKR